jgi:hypothetical protein
MDAQKKNYDSMAILVFIHLLNQGLLSHPQPLYIMGFVNKMSI